MVYLIRFLVWLYRRLLKPILSALSGGGAEGCCRFHPSCSQYMLEAVEIHGAWKGLYLGIRRILRCNPWGGQGYDPVPPKKDRKPHK